jgi:signal transduction histidine kinase
MIHVFNICMLSTLFLTSIENVGLAAPSLIWVMDVILMTGFLLDRRSLQIWTVLTIAGFFALYIFVPHFDYLKYPSYQTDSLIQHTLATLILAIQIYAVAELQRMHVKDLETLRSELRQRFEQNANLLRILSHDVATPLSVAQMSVEAMDQGELFDMRRNRTITALSQLSTILNEVRDLQAIIDGKKKAELISINIEEIIHSSLDIFREKLDAKSLQIKIEAENCQVSADPFFLRHQVMGNLISNAIKFSNVGSSIEIRVKNLGDRICVSVSDHGEGIPPEILPHLFLLNHKTSRSGTQGEKGTGFGMPIMKTAVEAMQGEIQVESKFRESNPDSHGTEFKIWLKSA